MYRPIISVITHCFITNLNPYQNRIIINTITNLGIIIMYCTQVELIIKLRNYAISLRISFLSSPLHGWVSLRRRHTHVTLKYNLYVRLQVDDNQDQDRNCCRLLSSRFRVLVWVEINAELICLLTITAVVSMVVMVVLVQVLGSEKCRVDLFVNNGCGCCKGSNGSTSSCCVNDRTSRRKRSVSWGKYIHGYVIWNRGSSTSNCERNDDRSRTSSNGINKDRKNISNCVFDGLGSDGNSSMAVSTLHSIATIRSYYDALKTLTIW